MLAVQCTVCWQLSLLSPYIVSLALDLGRDPLLILTVPRAHFPLAELMAVFFELSAPIAILLLSPKE